MHNYLQLLGKSLKESKNKIVDNYYSFRICRRSDPYRILFRSQPYRILLVLGHMRSGSSLLTHILNTNPEIIGFGETHIKYSSEQDFKQLMLKVYRKVGGVKMPQKYVLDKILHNSKILNQEILESDRVYKIFLVREPQRSMASIMKIKPHWSESKTMEHYQRRLLVLEDYAKLIPNQDRNLFITHEQLVNKTGAVFKRMQQFLDVKEPFSEQYEVLKTTGRRGIGDSSGNIKSGRIVRDDRRPETTIDREAIAQGKRAFEQCYATMSEYCQTVDPEMPRS